MNRSPVQPHTSRGPAGAYFRRWVLLRAVLFAVLCAMAVWSAIAYEHAKLRTQAEAQSKRDVFNLARAFSEEVKSTVTTVDVSLIALRSHWLGDRRRFAAVVRELNEQLQSKVIFQVGVTDANGTVQFVSSGAPPGQLNVGDREHIRVHLKGSGDRLFISRPVIGRASRLWSVQFTRPIFDGGKLAGVIVASVAPDYFSRFYGKIDLGPGASIALVRSGVVLARSSSDGSKAHVGADLKGYPYTPNKETSGHFRRIGQLDGVERNYAWQKLPEYGLIVTVGQSLADATARYASRQRFATLMGTAILAALALLGWIGFAAAYNRKRAVRALSSAEARWQLALGASGAGVWDWDHATNTAVLTPQAQALLGIDAPAVHWNSDTLHGNVHPDDMAQVAASLREHVDGAKADYMAEYRIVRHDGSTTWIAERAMVVERSDAGTPTRVVGTVTNIDHRKVQEEQMRHQASHDALTGLANRALFSDRLQQARLRAIRDKTQLAVIYFDLDKFKPVNDTWGHATGDQLLVAVAQRVRASLRQSDTLARLGGDEFAVLLSTCASATDAMKVGANILALLDRPFHADGHELHISGSIGVAVFPECGPGADQLVQCADQAMYRSKRNGRGQVTLFRAGEMER